jgi:argininosuccinate lyase
MQDNSDSNSPSSKTWSGRFSEPVAELVKRYTASITFDQRMAEYDIQGSIAHARMLGAQGIISKEDVLAIEAGLAEILQEIRNGEFDWSLDLEDVHLNVEMRLTSKIGDAGKRLHTGRSRNDQVATDIRLWLRATTDSVIEKIRALQTSIVDLAEEHYDTGFHASTGCTARHLWSPPIGLFRDAATRCRAFR